MPPNRHKQVCHPHVQFIMDETGESDPAQAVRMKARAVVEQYHALLGEAPPFNMQALASVRGLRWSDDDPRYSADSEIAPEADGSVVLRVNKERPLARQRFSIGHEIGHTLFPDYELAVRCRKANAHAWANEDDLLEMLCDVAASELLFPYPWFTAEIESNPLSGEFNVDLASRYQASREATCRRLVECHPEPLAAVFLSWKLKPTEKRLVKQNQNQLRMFSDIPFDAPSPMLPKAARWAILQGNAKQPTIGKFIDDAMTTIEKDNPSLRIGKSSDDEMATIVEPRTSAKVDSWRRPSSGLRARF